jgi:hypothetical protein
VPENGPCHGADRTAQRKPDGSADGFSQPTHYILNPSVFISPPNAQGKIRLKTKILVAFVFFVVVIYMRNNLCHHV